MVGNMHNNVKVISLVDTLQGTSVGQIAMLNFIDAVESGVFSREIAKEFIIKWAEESYEKEPNEIKNIFWKVAQQFPSNFMLQGKKYIFSQIELYTVLAYSDLKTRLSNSIDKKYREIFDIANEFCLDFNNRNYSSMEENEEDLLSVQEDLTSGINYFETELKIDEFIKSDHAGLIWFSTDIAGRVLKGEKCYKSTMEHLADIARDNLGLSHFGTDLSSEGKKYCPLLVAIKIKIEDKDLFRPTVIDSGAHERFRGAFGNLKEDAKNYGRATQLEVLSDINGELGSMEIVTSNFNPIKVWLTFLGYPRVPRNDFLGVNDNLFCSNISHGRTPETIARSFLSI
jgi:hypothetical protein